MRRFTKDCLFDALCKIMGRKDMSKITITEVTDMAGVSRATFYRNYNSIEDIITEFLLSFSFGVTLKDDIFDDTFDFEKLELEKHIREYFSFVCARKTFFTKLANSKNANLIFDAMDNFCNNTVFKRYLYYLGFREKYEISAFVGFWYKMSLDWIKDGMPDVEDAIQTALKICESVGERLH